MYSIDIQQKIKRKVISLPVNNKYKKNLLIAFEIS